MNLFAIIMLLILNGCASPWWIKDYPECNGDYTRSCVTDRSIFDADAIRKEH
jgi:hypothetical protein